MNIMNQNLKIIIALTIGSALEYYDFIIFALMAKYIGILFFPKDDAICSVGASFCVFAIGYLIRPIGGTIIGMIADTIGRKKPIISVMYIMGLSTLAIGLLPTYEQIGFLSTLLLIFCRLVQGISFGAELPGATTILSELKLNQSQNGFYRFIISGTALGSLCATASISLLTWIFSENQIHNWAWRIPFLIGGVLAILSYYLRKTIFETPKYLEIYESINRNKIITPFKILIKNNLPQIAIAIGLTFFLANLIIINIYFPTYISKYFYSNSSEIFRAMTVSMIFSVIFIICFGKLSDYYSSFAVVLTFLIFYLFALVPIFKLLRIGTLLNTQIFLIVHQLAIAIFFTNYLPLISRLFSVNIRYTGLGFSYNIAFSLAAIVPSIISYFINIYDNPDIVLLPILASTIIGLISISALYFYSPDKKLSGEITDNSE